jgi:uncharacterized membrane protein YcaP (DUF421 family)
MEILDQVVMNQNLQLVEEQLDSLERRLKDKKIKNCRS